MHTVLAVTFLILFAGVLGLFLNQKRLRHFTSDRWVISRDRSTSSKLKALFGGDEERVDDAIDREQRKNPEASKSDAEQSVYDHQLQKRTQQ